MFATPSSWQHDPPPILWESTMPVDARKPFGEIVKEIMDSYHRTGKIGNITPKNAAHALRIAKAIATRAKAEHAP